MHSTVFLITYIILFPTLATFAFLLSITTFIRAQRAQLRAYHRVRSLEKEFIVLIQTIDHITTLAEADRRSIQNLATTLQETQRRIERQENQGASLTNSHNMAVDRRLNQFTEFQRRGLSASQATAQSRRMGGISRSAFQYRNSAPPHNLLPGQPSSIPRPTIQPAITLTTPQQTHLRAYVHSPPSTPHTPRLSPPQILTTETQGHILSALRHILIFRAPTLSTSTLR